MRKLLLTRGIPGCGKSTWIEENGLEPYTLSSDRMRLLFGNFSMDVNGVRKVSMRKDKMVWDTLIYILEERMKTGEFTVIDATNIKLSDMNKYINLAKRYRYEVYCVDFTDVSIDVAKERNAKRDVSKVVPESVLDRMYAQLENNQLPATIKSIKPDELNKIFVKPVNLDQYYYIRVIGDIHGCATCLQDALVSKAWNFDLDKNTFYIFLGDYIDRGIQNVQTVNILHHWAMTKDNVMFLEGNHDVGLKHFANNDMTKGNQDFKRYTLPEFQESLEKRTANEFYNKLQSYFYFEFRGVKYLCNHGGISNFTEETAHFISDSEFIRGSGDYEDLEQVVESFKKCNDIIQFHGHRNIYDKGFTEAPNMINLEGKVEFGGYLRVVTILNAVMLCDEIKNHCFKIQEGVVTPEEFKRKKGIV